MPVDRSTPIVLLHGLGARPLTLLGVQLWLKWYGYLDVRTIEYPADTAPLDECIDAVDRRLVDEAFDRSRPLVVIGQSMGGVIGRYLHERQWTIELLITIGSPLHGARLLNQVAAWLPQTMIDALSKKNYDHLRREQRTEPPPHTIHCITMSWPLVETFDGCVYVDEAHYPNRPHTHIAWMDHRSGFANPRLWNAVVDALIA